MVCIFFRFSMYSMNSAPSSRTRNSRMSFQSCFSHGFACSLGHPLMSNGSASNTSLLNSAACNCVCSRGCNNRFYNILTLHTLTSMWQGTSWKCCHTVLFVIFLKTSLLLLHALPAMMTLRYLSIMQSSLANSLFVKLYEMLPLTAED